MLNRRRVEEDDISVHFNVASAQVTDDLSDVASGLNLVLTFARAYDCPCFYQRLAFARLSAHSRYRAPKRRQVSNWRRVLKRRRLLRLLRCSLSMLCKSRHHSRVCTARTHLKMCFLLAKWKHAVPTYIQRGHRLRWGMIDPSSFAICMCAFFLASRVGKARIIF